jgi:thiol-disulfide isomerase/thioredoxin
VTKPILEKLADEYNGKVEFLPVNADDSREVLEQFRIAGIPTVLALRNGDVVGRVTGAQNESGYRLMFAGLAEGGEVKIPISSFDRFLRLGAGMVFVIVGISTGSWLAVGVGGLLAFFSVSDRCPVWRAITGTLSR